MCLVCGSPTILGCDICDGFQFISADACGFCHLFPHTAFALFVFVERTYHARAFSFFYLADKIDDFLLPPRPRYFPIEFDDFGDVFLPFS